MIFTSLAIKNELSNLDSIKEDIELKTKIKHVDTYNHWFR
jgi:hypothetical protein